MITKADCIENRRFDEERALYHLCDTTVKGCTFAGPADGESVLKECRRIRVEDCTFSLRYPLWHAEGYELIGSRMDALTRAPLWYSRDGVIDHCTITGVKCLRECDDTDIRHSRIASEEFGWRCRHTTVSDSELESPYLFFECRDLTLNRVRMRGKYSFQYVEGLVIRDSDLDTKDAFWHSKNVLVENSTVKGEYLGWFSEGLTLRNCHIVGTQPLCYCKNLRLIDCTMEGTDLSFEYSDVEATVRGHILSIKNPRSGYIEADTIGERVYEGSIIDSVCDVRERESN